ncbi:hypothetical protein BN1013_00201 [Candidatus Rubidus massiliensis]|nr:hypothetical protein BN1013_00201 [Candidatus Rubidus massiliensis]
MLNFKNIFLLAVMSFIYGALIKGVIFNYLDKAEYKYDIRLKKKFLIPCALLLYTIVIFSYLVHLLLFR